MSSQSWFILQSTLQCLVKVTLQLPSLFYQPLTPANMTLTDQTPHFWTFSRCLLPIYSSWPISEVCRNSTVLSSIALIILLLTNFSLLRCLTLDSAQLQSVAPPGFALVVLQALYFEFSTNLQPIYSRQWSYALSSNFYCSTCGTFQMIFTQLDIFYLSLFNQYLQMQARRPSFPMFLFSVLV